jgi:hypothetical protein
MANGPASEGNQHWIQNKEHEKQCADFKGQIGILPYPDAQPPRGQAYQ